MVRLILVCCFLTSIFSQELSPEEIFNRADKNFDSIEDYKAEINIKVDLDYIKIPKNEGTIYYKAPDKFHFDSKGFAILPRNSFNNNPVKLFNNDFDYIVSGTDTINQELNYKIKAIPKSDTLDIMVATVWIGKNNFRVNRLNSSTRKAGEININFVFDKNSEYPIPSEIEVLLNPGKTIEEKEEGSGRRHRFDPANISGIVNISYKNVLVNSGVEDSIFENIKEK